MKAHIAKVKNARGRIRGYSAHIGKMGTAKSYDTKAEAVTAIEADVLAALDRLSQGDLTVQQHGRTAIISPSFCGWVTHVIRDDGSVSCSGTSNGTREENEAGVRFNLAQFAWTHEVEDDGAFVAKLPDAKTSHGFIRNELQSWIKWQREYRRLVAAGRSDNDARQIIGGFLKETA